MEDEFEVQELVNEEKTDKEDELDIYTEEGINESVDDDAISPIEQGFMMGYLGA
jgi:hypothetical protein